jgi:membrane-associated phospholipid phosphatase
LADWLSYLLHPAVMMVVTVLIISRWVRGNWAWAMIDVGILLAGLLPGLVYIFVKARRGQFSHYHLIVKEERRGVLLMLFAGMLASFALYGATAAPAIMLRGMVAGLVTGAGAIGITRFWKISLHATVAMGCAALFLPFSWYVVAAFAICAVVVGVARLAVHHHTLAQVIAGWVYGFGVTAVLVIGLLIV